MYADTGPLNPYFQDFCHEVQQLVLEDLFHSHQSPCSMIGNSFNSEYDMGGGGDLFKASKAIFEEPIPSLDPVLDSIETAVSMPTENLKVGNLESLQNDELFYEVSYECKNDNFGNSSTDPDITNELTMMPSFIDFPDLDFGAAYRMRRAFSEGDIKTLGNANISLIQSSSQWPRVSGFSCSSEDRQQKLSRYRIKKSKRNFARKIKYACRKALADSQPRIRGRFAKI